MATFTGTSQRTTAATPLDFIAELINIHRLPGETLKDFKLRVLDVYIHPANASYMGLYNGMARELGVSAYAGGIVIDVARDTDGTPLDTEAVVEVTSKYIRFGTASGPNELVLSLHDRIGGAYFLQDLLASVEAEFGTSFEIVKWGTSTDFDKSLFLKRDISIKDFSRIRLQPSKLHTFPEQLKDGWWISRAVFSADSGIFSQNSIVTDPADLALGEFLVGDDARVLYTYDFPTGDVSLRASSFPFVLPISPVSVREFKDELFLDLITEQLTEPTANEVLPTSERLVDGIPNVRGADLINELLAVVPMYWGE